MLFPAVFGALGGAISVIFGILVGNRFSYITFFSFVSLLVFAGIGFAVYTILEKKVPEFLEFIGTISLADFRFSSSDSSDYAESGGFASSGSGGGGGDYGASSMGDGSESYVQKSSSKPMKVGDTLVIDKIVLKNEPKLMAEAIRTIMAKDDVQDS